MSVFPRSAIDYIAYVACLMTDAMFALSNLYVVAL